MQEEQINEQQPDVDVELNYVLVCPEPRQQVSWKMPEGWLSRRGNVFYQLVDFLVGIHRLYCSSELTTMISPCPVYEYFSRDICISVFCFCITRESCLLIVLYGGRICLVPTLKILCETGAYELTKYMPDLSQLNVPGIVYAFAAEGHEAIHDVRLSRPTALAHTLTLKNSRDGAPPFFPRRARQARSSGAHALEKALHGHRA